MSRLRNKHFKEGLLPAGYILEGKKLTDLHSSKYIYHRNWYLIVSNEGNYASLEPLPFAVIDKCLKGLSDFTIYVSDEAFLLEEKQREVPTELDVKLDIIFEENGLLKAKSLEKVEKGSYIVKSNHPILKTSSDTETEKDEEELHKKTISVSRKSFLTFYLKQPDVFEFNDEPIELFVVVEKGNIPTEWTTTPKGVSGCILA